MFGRPISCEPRIAISAAVAAETGGPGLNTRNTLALTTANRNAALGLVIVSKNFADTPAVTAVVAYALDSILGSLGCPILLGVVSPGPPEISGLAVCPRERFPLRMEIRIVHLTARMAGLYPTSD